LFAVLGLYSASGTPDTFSGNFFLRKFIFYSDDSGSVYYKRFDKMSDAEALGTKLVIAADNGLFSLSALSELQGPSIAPFRVS
jgi:hypothetical protein